MAPFGDFSSFQTPSLNAITNYIFIHNIISLPTFSGSCMGVYRVCLSIIFRTPYPTKQNRLVAFTHASPCRKEDRRSTAESRAIITHLSV